MASKYQFVNAEKYPNLFIYNSFVGNTFFHRMGSGLFIPLVPIEKGGKKVIPVTDITTDSHVYLEV